MFNKELSWRALSQGFEYLQENRSVVSGFQFQYSSQIAFQGRFLNKYNNVAPTAMVTVMIVIKAHVAKSIIGSSVV
jgi:hypothetical protein